MIQLNCTIKHKINLYSQAITEFYNLLMLSVNKDITDELNMCDKLFIAFHNAIICH